MWLYSDFIEINQRFYEFFSENADRVDAQYWKTFIPHEAMIKLLDGLLRALEGTTRKSLWIHGAYGTGKTHAQFVLKHMLEDPWTEVQEYFREHHVGADLEKRLEGVRQRGQGLVVYRSSSASVDSNRRLMAELQLGIKAALEAKGCKGCVTPTLYDRVLEYLSGGGRILDWGRAFEKHRGEFLDFPSAEDVVRQLAAPGDMGANMALMERVARVLDAEGFILLDDPATIKAWLKEIIAQNGLQWLVFIWDEFTDFFLNVRTLTGLQELAHLSTEAPFYLLLATHRSPALLQQQGGNPDWPKLRDRFSVFHYDMEPVTAYQLMRHALRCKPGSEEQWKRAQEALWDTVRLGARNLLGDNDRPEDLRALVPIHPYAAFLLSQIARQFSSSQRTMFRFLRRSEEGSFSAFIGEYPQQGWRWYTADSLWDYFFSKAGQELPSGFRDALSYYQSREAMVGDEQERRAFKATLLLLGLSREITNNPRLQPTLNTLRAAYLGTPLGGRLDSVMEALSQRELVHRIIRGPNDWHFTIPVGNVDHGAVKNYSQEYRQRFCDLLRGPSQEAMSPLAYQLFHGAADDVLKRRLALVTVGAPEVERRRERVGPAKEPNQVGVVVTFSQDDGERAKALDLARKLAADGKGVVYVVPEAPFGQERWGEWCEQKATARWYKENNDPKNAQYHENTALEKVGEWTRALKAGQMQVFYSEGGPDAPITPINASGVDGYVRALEEIVGKRFRYRPELLSETATLYRESYGVSGAEIGLGIGSARSAPYNVLAEQLRRQGLWPEGAGSLAGVCAARPEHPLSRMKAAVEAMFTEQDSVRLDDVWEKLQAPPFGLFPSPMAIVLMGLLLRDYVEGYYWRDQVNTRPLDPTKMAELINDVMHHRQQIMLTRSTPEARQFCALLRQAFELNPEESRYPENAREALRRMLTSIGYPLWAMQYCAREERLESIPLLVTLLADTSQVGLGNERLAAIVPTLRTEAAALTHLVRQRPFEGGMRRFIEREVPELLPLAGRLGIAQGTLMGRLRSLMNQETWLWQEEEVRQRLPGLHAELEVVAALDELLGKQDVDLDAALGSLRARLQEVKLPLFVLCEGVGDAPRAVLNELDRLVQGEVMNPSERLWLAKNLRQEREGVRAALEQRLPALGAWVKANLGTEVTPEEAAQILETLPPLGPQPSPTVLKNQVGVRLRELSKRKLLEELKNAWQELTGSPSPERWGAAHGVPIHWVLDGPEYHELFSLLGAPDRRSEEEIRAALELIRCHQDTFRGLGEESAAGEALLAVALGAYRELVQEQSDISELKAHLAQRAGARVHGWERSRVRELGREWVQRVYQERFYQQVAHKVEDTPEAELKALLRELARDPMVGLLLMRRTRGAR